MAEECALIASLSLVNVKAPVMVRGPGPAGEHAAQPDGHCLGHEVPALPGHCAQVDPPLAYTTPDTAQLPGSDLCMWLDMHVGEMSCMRQQPTQQSNARRRAASGTTSRREHLA